MKDDWEPYRDQIKTPKRTNAAPASATPIAV